MISRTYLLANDPQLTLQAVDENLQKPRPWDAQEFCLRSTANQTPAGAVMVAGAIVLAVAGVSWLVGVGLSSSLTLAVFGVALATFGFLLKRPR